MSKLHVGTFFTENTPYEDIVKEYLIPSCKELGIEPIVIAIPNQGSWMKNAAEKPKAIEVALINYVKNGDVLLFLDADSILERNPTELLDIPPEYTLGYHTLDWNSWYGYHHQPAMMELLTGTMIFRHTSNIRTLCQEWHEMAKTTPIWEQKVLQSLVPKYRHVKVYDLPIEYCYMDSLPDGREPLVKCDNVVVRHFQKSREYRGVMK